MSVLRAFLRRLAAWLTEPTAIVSSTNQPAPDHWADLPPHHPRCTEAPC